MQRAVAANSDVWNAVESEQFENMGSMTTVDLAYSKSAQIRRAYPGLLKSLLQDLLHILVNAVQLVLLDFALLKQLGPVLLVRVIVLLDGLQRHNASASVSFC